MATKTDREITRLLFDWSHGDRQALDRLMPLVTRELRRLARSYLERESANHTLQPTALVNELYLRLVGNHSLTWQNRAHFFAFAAKTMRRILVDHARARKTVKRGSNVNLVALDEAREKSDAPDVEILALHEALNALATMDSRQSQIVELRTFAGLGLREIAEVLGVSRATVSREWASAKAWLYGELVMRPER